MPLPRIIMLEKVAKELEKRFSIEQLNMMAEHYPKWFAYEVKITKRLIENEPKENNIITV